MAAKRRSVNKASTSPGRSPARGAAAKSAPAKRTTTTTAKKKTATKKPTAKKVATKKAVAKKATAKKSGGGRTTAKSGVVGRATASARPTVAAHMRLHLLEVPFEEKDAASSAGARWNPQLRSWTYLARRDIELPGRLRGYAAAPHSWEAWQQDDINQENPAQRGAETSTVTLHPHQRDAAEQIARAHRDGRPGFLLADEVGLGKTYSALAGIEALPGPKNVLILCPLAVVYHWRRSIDAIGGQHRYCVINYDRAKKLLEIPQSAQNAKRTRTKNQRTANKGVPTVAWDVIIADESHLLKNPTAQRSAAVRQLQTGVRNGSFMIWCSATAGQNPVELSYLNRLIASLTGRKLGPGIEDYADWCRDLGIKVKKSFGGLAWDPNPDDLERIRGILFDPANPGALRRRPGDIAGWPELERIAWPIELPLVDRDLYREAWEEVRQVALKDRETRANGGRPRRGVADPTNPLVALLRFRQKASALRIDNTVELTETLLENGKQVAVSVEFHDTLRALQARLEARKIAVSVIHGGQPVGEKEENRLRFQTGETPVILFTVKEGISLHAGERSSNATATQRITIVHDPRWDAISTAQIEGRTWRDGQHSSCYHTYAAGTVEEKVVATMLKKLEAMKTMLTDDPQEIAALLDTLLD